MNMLSHHLRLGLALMGAAPNYIFMRRQYSKASEMIMLVALFLTSSCTREADCNDTIVETANLTSDELSKIPYTGFDTLYFLNKQGDTCIVRGTGKQYYYEAKNESGNPSCPPIKTVYNQAYKINFVPVKGDLEFEVSQTRLDWSFSVYPRFNPKFNEPFYTIEYNFLNAKPSGGWENRFIDSIQINHSFYRSVYKMLTNNGNGMTMTDTSYVCLINNIDGVLYMKSGKDNKEFSILNKK